PLSDIFPHLAGLIEDSLDDVDVALLKEKADVVFTATPSGISLELVPQLIDAGLRVIDLSGDFRLKSGVLYEQWYKHKPAADVYLDQAVYGLSEVFHEDIRGARFISNPGCFSTAALLGLIPALSSGWIDPKTIIIDAKSGVSGAGKGLSLSTHYAEINENLYAYKINKHQHTPEIEQVLSQISGTEIITTFTTHLVPMTRGILCTMYVNLAEELTDQAFIDLYERYYRDRPFVRIRQQGKYPATKQVWGSNYCDIGFSVDPRTKRLTILSVIDNVVKGAAGQAVQNLNLMMGWDETLGLDFTPVYP
ncbi:MAG TPA: N-acetyl-gamma-glutamyl-phosphate reductase, partial [Bacilli bacterium]